MRVLNALAGLVVLAASAAGGLYLTDRILAASDPQAEDRGNNSAAIRVETISPQIATFQDSVRAVGTARARHAIEITPEADGRIDEITFQPGAQLAADAVLIRLDDRAAQADLKAAEATLAEAEAAFQRQEQLNRSGSSSDAAFQTARAALLRAEAERDRAQIALEDRTIRAPFPGVVGLTDLVEGQMIDTGTVIATLDDLEVIEVDFSVPETLLPQLRVGQRVALTSSAWPDRVFDGRISRIDTRVDAATRSIALRAEVPNDDRAIAGGMFMQAELVLAERQSVAVPERAITVSGDRNLVLVAQDGVARQVQVRIGRQHGDLIEILDGLSTDARIIMTNLHRVQPGMTVDPVPSARSAAAPSADGIEG